MVGIIATFSEGSSEIASQTVTVMSPGPPPAARSQSYLSELAQKLVGQVVSVIGEWCEQFVCVAGQSQTSHYLLPLEGALVRPPP